MNTHSLSLHFLHKHPQEAARVLEKFESSLLAQYLAQLPVETAAGVLRYIIPSIASASLEHMTDKDAGTIITHLDMERAALLLRRMAEDRREQLLGATTSSFAKIIRQVLRYAEGTVGRAMDPGIFTVTEDMRVSEVINAVRMDAGHMHNEIFVVNAKQEPTGVVAVRQLLIADSMEAMKNIVHPLGDTVPARASLLSVLNSTHWEHRDNVPVVDHQGMFIGVLHRRALPLTTTGHNIQNEYASTAMAMAELFWDVCVHMLPPGHDKQDKGSSDERSN